VADFEIAVPLSDQELAALDEAVSAGRFPSRADAIRHALGQLLRSPDGRAVEESYRRAYAEHPEEEWIGEAGLRLLDDRVRGERR
jgi:Arc/MetJ-type ribon-helix-helix transcriptional regulator